VTPAQEARLAAARKRQAHTTKAFRAWKKRPPADLDQRFHRAHEEVFAQTDCLTCANCCRTTSPLFRERDVERLARHLRLRPADFHTRYLRMDEDGDWVLQQTPCPFLDLTDHRCQVYEHRPAACREYPHTDRKHMAGILDLTARNALICPAVAQIVERITAFTER
jgi:hypothetical protein